MNGFLGSATSHILVVEDDCDLHAVLKVALEYDGYYATFTQMKAAAIALLSAVKVDLVIADVGLADGLGTEVVKHATTVGVPSIVMTGNPNHMRDLELKAASYLPKPFNMERFRQEVRDNLRRGEQPPQTARGLSLPR